uniref:inositol-1,3,4-trisphosphate 5/6-kinase n=1 Tax=Chromera velia CCMP2878 TaxID=1169474 RepID=A0A0G4HS18_9ALVE|eukprot:Cvel_8189.t1-p1 / transcript=Cvel_8189.t1 / gene=Cvel_8189 / organism=Chromera_velia_CCMP2878 / gene_product=Uncharacterized HAD-hydrolase PH1655, putative / transcript_product=Uncharacterized HAD-hydrolase PH1655, putative / location=Cvel_scaffold446:36434-47744(-) / protein_length=2317 / sequence_SO=supercontig / SO=protein_coding / is_pseudo=false
MPIKGVILDFGRTLVYPSNPSATAVGGGGTVKRKDSGARLVRHHSMIGPGSHDSSVFPVKRNRGQTRGDCMRERAQELDKDAEVDEEEEPEMPVLDKDELRGKELIAEFHISRSPELRGVDGDKFFTAYMEEVSQQRKRKKERKEKQQKRRKEGIPDDDKDGGGGTEGDKKFLNRVTDTLQKMGVDGSKENHFQEIVRNCCISVLASVSQKSWAMVEGAHEALMQLHRRYRLALCTNSNEADKQNQLIDYFGIRKFFDIVLVSGEAGVRKPQPETMKRVAREWGYHPSEIVAVGDQLPKDVLCAHAAHMHSIWFPTHAGEPKAVNERCLQKVSTDFRVGHLSQVAPLIAVMDTGLDARRRQLRSRLGQQSGLSEISQQRGDTRQEGEQEGESAVVGGSSVISGSVRKGRVEGGEGDAPARVVPSSGDHVEVPSSSFLSLSSVIHTNANANMISPEGAPEGPARMCAEAQTQKEGGGVNKDGASPENLFGASSTEKQKEGGKKEKSKKDQAGGEGQVEDPSDLREILVPEIPEFPCRTFSFQEFVDACSACCEREDSSGTPFASGSSPSRSRSSQSHPPQSQQHQQQPQGARRAVTREEGAKEREKSGSCHSRMSVASSLPTKPPVVVAYLISLKKANSLYDLGAFFSTPQVIYVPVFHTMSISKQLSSLSRPPDVFLFKVTDLLVSPKASHRAAVEDLEAYLKANPGVRAVGSLVAQRRVSNRIFLQRLIKDACVAVNARMEAVANTGMQMTVCRVRPPTLDAGSQLNLAGRCITSSLSLTHADRDKLQQELRHYLQYDAVRPPCNQGKSQTPLRGAGALLWPEPPSPAPAAPPTSRGGSGGEEASENVCVKGGVYENPREGRSSDSPIPQTPEPNITAGSPLVPHLSTSTALHMKGGRSTDGDQRQTTAERERENENSLSPSRCNQQSLKPIRRFPRCRPARTVYVPDLQLPSLVPRRSSAEHHHGGAADFRSDREKETEADAATTVHPSPAAAPLPAPTNSFATAGTENRLLRSLSVVPTSAPLTPASCPLCAIHLPPSSCVDEEEAEELTLPSASASVSPSLHPSRRGTATATSSVVIPPRVSNPVASLTQSPVHAHRPQPPIGSGERSRISDDGDREGFPGPFALPLSVGPSRSGNGNGCLPGPSHAYHGRPVADGGRNEMSSFVATSSGQRAVAQPHPVVLFSDREREESGVWSASSSASSGSTSSYSFPSGHKRPEDGRGGPVVVGGGIFEGSRVGGLEDLLMAGRSGGLLVGGGRTTGGGEPSTEFETPKRAEERSSTVRWYQPPQQQKGGNDIAGSSMVVPGGGGGEGGGKTVRGRRIPSCCLATLGEELKRLGVIFPVVLKRPIAVGPLESHDIAVVFDLKSMFLISRSPPFPTAAAGGARKKKPGGSPESPQTRERERDKPRSSTASSIGHSAAGTTTTVGVGTCRAGLSTSASSRLQSPFFWCVTHGSSDEGTAEEGEKETGTVSSSRHPLEEREREVSGWTGGKEGNIPVDPFHRPPRLASTEGLRVTTRPALVNPEHFAETPDIPSVVARREWGGANEPSPGVPQNPIWGDPVVAPVGHVVPEAKGQTALTNTTTSTATPPPPAAILAPAGAGTNRPHGGIHHSSSSHTRLSWHHAGPRFLASPLGSAASYGRSSEPSRTVSSPSSSSVSCSSSRGPSPSTDAITVSSSANVVPVQASHSHKRVAGGNGINNGPPLLTSDCALSTGSQSPSFPPPDLNTVISSAPPIFPGHGGGGAGSRKSVKLSDSPRTSAHIVPFSSASSVAPTGAPMSSRSQSQHQIPFRGVVASASAVFGSGASTVALRKVETHDETEHEHEKERESRSPSLSLRNGPLADNVVQHRKAQQAQVGSPGIPTLHMPPHRERGGLSLPACVACGALTKPTAEVAENVSVGAPAAVYGPGTGSEVPHVDVGMSEDDPGTWRYGSVVQEFVDHGRRLWKVLVVGEHVRLLERQSLPSRHEHAAWNALEESLLNVQGRSGSTDTVDGPSSSSVQNETRESAVLPGSLSPAPAIGTGGCAIQRFSSTETETGPCTRQSSTATQALGKSRKGTRPLGVVAFNTVGMGALIHALHAGQRPRVHPSQSAPFLAHAAGGPPNVPLFPEGDAVVDGTGACTPKPQRGERTKGSAERTHGAAPPRVSVTSHDVGRRYYTACDPGSLWLSGGEEGAFLHYVASHEDLTKNTARNGEKGGGAVDGIHTSRAPRGTGSSEVGGASGGVGFRSHSLVLSLSDSAHLPDGARAVMIALVEEFAEQLGCRLFGLDVLVEEATGDLVVVDVNFFPTFNGVPDFPSILRLYLSQLAAKHS